MDCSICCEKFNKRNHSKINCKTCDTDVLVCQSCAKRYILDKPTDASCMVCKVEWDIEFLSENFTKKFVNKELKEHKENYLLEKQLALLPDTQQYAENLKLVNGLEEQVNLIVKKKDELYRQIKIYNKNIQELHYTIYDLKNRNEKQGDKKQFTYKCPVENCNGFLNQKYECGICDNKICKHCMEIKTEEHECSEEKKKTVELLRHDTKPCPKCGQLIHKLPNGCDQMYCIKCHTAFSWRTGNLERGTIHNPEYYRWMRENGQNIPRNPLDIVPDPCGNNLVDYSTLLILVRFYYPPVMEKKNSITYTNNQRITKDLPETIKIINMHRMVGHIIHLNRNYQGVVNYNETYLRECRAEFILNKLNKTNFKKKLQMLEKKQNKEKKMNDIWNVLRLVILEYIGKITEKKYELEEGKKIIKNIVIESEKVREYCNTSFSKIGKMLNMTYPGINSEWVQIYNWEKHVKHLLK